MSDIKFGLFAALPANPRPTQAWGARAIAEENWSWRRWQQAGRHERKRLGKCPGMFRVELVSDRQSWLDDSDEAAESRSRLSGLLNAGPLGKAIEQAARLLDSGEMRPDRGGVLTLFQDERLCVLGTTNASCGYLYMVAWEKPQE